MKCFPVVNTTLLLGPQLKLNDKFGAPNAFLEMNPSFWLNDDGSYVVLIRRVNYRKFADKRFVLYDRYCESKYLVFRGNWDMTKPFSLDGSSCSELEIVSPFPLQATHWYGVEDIRFISETQVLGTFPQYNPGGQPAMYLCSFEGSKLTVLKQCQPSACEKNWMPVELFESVIYSCSPLRLKDIVTEEFTNVDTTPELDALLKGYHGSTNAIQCRNGFLTLIHKNEDRVVHRWLWISTSCYDVILSEPFVFFPHSYIEFPLSLVRQEGRLFVSLGVNDDKACLIELSSDDLFQFLKHPSFTTRIDSL
jgi:hypothetical protein